jgi:flagellar biosynthesis chaperone FliJ
MKTFKVNKFLTAGLLLLVTALLFILGKGPEAHGIAMATGAVISLTDAEKKEFNEAEQKMVLAIKKMAVELKDSVDKGFVSKEELHNAVKGIKSSVTSEELKALQDQLKELETAAEKQGTTLQEISAKLSGAEGNFKSIADQLKADETELRTIYKNRTGVKEYILNVTSKGEWQMKPYDSSKATGTHATVDGVGAGVTSSVTQNIDATTLLRLGAGSNIVSNFRNTPWIFSLCNLINVGVDNKFFMWFDEQAVQGGSTNVAEGGTKPKQQYSYKLQTAPYKKEAVLVSFTDEFSLDFQQLQSDIMSKVQIDLFNRINIAVLTDLIANGSTAYNLAYTGITAANDWDVLAAMAAQVENNTFASLANTAIMTTIKKYKLGTIKDAQNRWLNPPDVLNNLGIVSNPDATLGADGVLVGDFKNYNIALRGGVIVRMGYNGTDFAENKFSTLTEQYYFNFISSIRKAAIVKGPDFATVRAAISAP